MVSLNGKREVIKRIVVTTYVFFLFHVVLIVPNYSVRSNSMPRHNYALWKISGRTVKRVINVFCEAYARYTSCESEDVISIHARK